MSDLSFGLPNSQERSFCCSKLGSLRRKEEGSGGVLPADASVMREGSVQIELKRLLKAVGCNKMTSWAFEAS